MENNSNSSQSIMMGAQKLPSIVGIGCSTVDILIRTSQLSTWSRAQSFSDFSMQGGGPASTAAVAASKMGISTGFIGTAGTDQIGLQKKRWMSEAAVDTSRMIDYNGAEKSIVVCYVNEETGDRIFSPKDNAFEGPIAASLLDREYFRYTRLLLIDGSHSEAALCCAQWVHENGGSVLLDASATNEKQVGSTMQKLVTICDILICGSGFAQALSQKSDIREALNFARTCGPSIAIQTEGGQGCFCTHDNEYYHLPSFDVPVKDTTGAGDVFHGAFGAAFLKGWSVRDCAQFASAVSAIKCTRLGGRAGIPTLDQVFSFLLERGIKQFWE